MKRDLIFCHVVAASQNNVIGQKNKLPWHIPEDLDFFHKVTKGKALIMGRKTFESLGSPLRDRLNVVVTQKKDLKIPGARVFSSLQEAMDHCSQEEIVKQYGKEICIIGGGEIYKQTLPLVQRLYLTRIHQSYEGDTFYPELPKGEFKEVSRDDKENEPAYSFLVYERALKKEEKG